MYIRCQMPRLLGFIYHVIAKWKTSVVQKETTVLPKEVCFCRSSSDLLCTDADWKTLREHPSLVNASVYKLPFQTNSPWKHQKTQKKSPAFLIDLFCCIILLTVTQISFSEVNNKIGSVWGKKKCQVILHLKYDLLVAVSRVLTPILPPTSEKNFTFELMSDLFSQKQQCYIWERTYAKRDTGFHLSWGTHAACRNLAGFIKRRPTT